jgi:signal recognition particle receptor subunit beta
MAFTNYKTQEINCKVIYFGAANSGKTANLRSIYTKTSPEFHAQELELGKEPGPTAYFDFLPVSLGKVRDFHLKLHLYTFPVRQREGLLTDFLLQGIDGLIFVVDSQIDALVDNLDAYSAMKSMIDRHRLNFGELPRVVQYNKRDMSNALPVDFLRHEFNPAGNPEHEAVAVQSVGTMETLQALGRQILERLSQNS